MLPIVIPLRAEEDRDWKVQPTPLRPLTSGVSVVGYSPDIYQTSSKDTGVQTDARKEF